MIEVKYNTTLIIHPDDRSTDFLKPIYENITHKTVVTGGKSRSKIRELIKSHDRVIMLGHGTGIGLFSVGQFGGGFIIDYSMVDILKDNPNNIYIWCNADKFILNYELKGIYSGMFISEVGEASYCLNKHYSQETVDKSNEAFAQVLGEALASRHSLPWVYNRMMKEYGKICDGSNDIAKYNHRRLYLAL